MLDLAKLEPPRREGLRALNVAALLEDFRRLGKSKGLPFCIRFALEAALLKNEPMKNQVTCYNVVRAFSTKVVTTVAQNWKRRRRGQLESGGHGRRARRSSGGCTRRTVRRGARGTLSPTKLCVSSRELRKRQWTARCDIGFPTSARSREAGRVPFYGRVGEGASAGAEPAGAACPRHADGHGFLDASIEFRGHSRAFHFELAAADRFVSSRIKFDAGEIVEHFTKRGGELAPIRCCGEDYYLFDKGISPTIHFLRTRPEADELDRFYSAENFLQSLGDFTGVKDSKLGRRGSRWPLHRRRRR